MSTYYMNNIKTLFNEKHGLKLLINHMPSFKSCSISVMIKVGSNYENNTIRGGAHLIEHMMFNGTKDIPSQKDISVKLDSLGADYNAYTTYNMTSYHIKVQEGFMDEVLYILSQMVLESKFTEKTLAKEKKVVIEELRRDRDDPSGYVMEQLGSILFKGNDLQNAIGGTEKSVRTMSYNHIRKFWLDNYRCSNILIAISGSFDEASTLASVEKYFKPSCHQKTQPRLKSNAWKDPLPLQKGFRTITQKRSKLKQIHLAIAFPTQYNMRSEEKFAMYIMKFILGGGMSSRLFLLVRQKYSFAYSISADVELFETCGAFSVHTGVDPRGMFTGNEDPSKPADPLKVIIKEIFKLTQKRVTREELSRAKKMMKGMVRLASENSHFIAEFYGKQWLFDLPILSLDQYIEKIEAVTRQDILEVARRIIQPNTLNISAIGDLENSRLHDYIHSHLHTWV